MQRNNINLWIFKKKIPFLLLLFLSLSLFSAGLGSGSAPKPSHFLFSFLLSEQMQRCFAVVSVRFENSLSFQILCNVCWSQNWYLIKIAGHDRKHSQISDFRSLLEKVRRRKLHGAPVKPKFSCEICDFVSTSQHVFKEHMSNEVNNGRKRAYYGNSK